MLATKSPPVEQYIEDENKQQVYYHSHAMAGFSSTFSTVSSLHSKVIATCDMQLSLLGWKQIVFGRTWLQQLERRNV